MTQPVSNDPWAAASAAPAAVAAAAPASPLADGYGPATGSSLLFNNAAAAPSLMNKTHPLGTERKGKIKSTVDKQDQDFNAKLPKYWSTSKVGGPQRNGAITTDAIDGPTGQANRPVMVTHITLETPYRMDAAECIAVGRDVTFVQSDNGDRVEVVGGFDYKPFQEAMVDARARGIELNSAADLEGKFLTVRRAGQTPPKSGQGNPSWVKAYRIDNA